MEVSAEKKQAAEVIVKDILGKLVELIAIVQQVVVEGTPNKVDDAIEPMVEPMEIEALKKLIDSIKL